MDIKIENETNVFKFRVCGILEHNNKYLVVKVNNNNFYCLPGGHVEIGEDTNQAILREMEEELGYAVKIQRLIAINQNFFTGMNGKSYHELAFYYLVNAHDAKNINTNDYVREELDKGKIQHLQFKWVTEQELKEIDFRPSFVVDCFDKLGTEITTTRNI